MEAVILAGGFGTRLKEIVSDIPKPMALVGGIPFLEHLLSELNAQGFSRAVLAVGYKKEAITDYFHDQYGNIKLIYSYEDTPLYTGGAVKQAAMQCESENIFVLNGDTYHSLSYADMYKFHAESQADLTIASAWMPDSSRYGTIEINDGKIASFHEKQAGVGGYINAGAYCMKRDLLLGFKKDAFSLETEFMQPFAGEKRFMAFVSKGYFIDIGIPEDYHSANRYFSGKAGHE